MRNEQIDRVRDALLSGLLIKKPQEVGGRIFTVIVGMERTDDACKDFKAAEEMAAYIVEGGMAL